MKLFLLERDADVSGVSGTGTIGECVQFSDGTVALRWLTRMRATGIYSSLGDAIAIHGHDGKTRFVEVTST